MLVVHWTPHKKVGKFENLNFNSIVDNFKAVIRVRVNQVFCEIFNNHSFVLALNSFKVSFSIIINDKGTFIFR